IGIITESLFNGSSEMVGHLSSAVTTFLFNMLMMKLIGIDGVAAITIIIYSQYLLTCLYMGFSMGVAPVFSFNYGKQDSIQMKRLFKICVTFLLTVSVLVFLLSIIGGSYLAGIFASRGSNVYSITKAGFLIVPYAYLFSGLNIYSSSLFTALSNGKLSALISFLRSFTFPVVGILLLPLLYGVHGIWLTMPLAEGFTFLISFTCICKSRRTYQLF
ncbi:MAG TPA: MATE family efflux transporter, partial [Chitinispirillaceae bacterium]|nr:MATE family efflux transporter [Chitinispirillaceae bacterium]